MDQTTIPAADLKRAVKIAGMARDKRSTTPILGSFLFQAGRLSATDLDTTASVVLGVDSSIVGLLDAGALTTAIKAAGKGAITIQQDGAKMALVVGATTIDANPSAFDPSDYPSIPTFALASTLIARFAATELASLAAPLYAVSKETGRFAICIAPSPHQPASQS